MFCNCSYFFCGWCHRGLLPCVSFEVIDSLHLIQILHVLGAEVFPVLSILLCPNIDDFLQAVGIVWASIPPPPPTKGNGRSQGRGSKQRQFSWGQGVASRVSFPGIQSKIDEQAISQFTVNDIYLSSVDCIFHGLHNSLCNNCRQLMNKMMRVLGGGQVMTSTP